MGEDYLIYDNGVDFGNITLVDNTNKIITNNTINISYPDGGSIKFESSEYGGTLNVILSNISSEELEKLYGKCAEELNLREI